MYYRGDGSLQYLACSGWPGSNTSRGHTLSADVTHDFGGGLRLQGRSRREKRPAGWKLPACFCSYIHSVRSRWNGRKSRFSPFRFAPFSYASQRAHGAPAACCAHQPPAPGLRTDAPPIHTCKKRGLRPVSFTRAAYRVRPHARPRNRLRAAHSTSAPRAPSASGWLAGTGVTWPAGAGGVTICRSTML